MKIVAVVQARVASSRLPAKILLDLAGRTALEHHLRRARRIDLVDDVILAIPDTPQDDILAVLAKRLGVGVVRGSENDVLARYYEAARATGADAIVRLTSDCPLLDPVVSSVVVRGFVEDGALAYASNTLERRLPRGLDTEIFQASALTKAFEDARDPSEREHVTAHLYRNRAKFRCASFVYPVAEDLSAHRWTLDTIDDYRFLFQLFESLGDDALDADMHRVLAQLTKQPELSLINRHIAQKA